MSLAALAARTRRLDQPTEKGRSAMFIVHPRSLGSCRLAFTVSLIWFLCTGAAIQAQPKPEPKGDSDKPAKIKTLLKERHDLLTQVAAKVIEQYKAGTVEFAKIAQAERDLLRATLELEESPEKRLAALRQHQKTAEGIVEILARHSRSQTYCRTALPRKVE